MVWQCANIAAMQVPIDAGDPVPWLVAGLVLVAVWVAGFAMVSAATMPRLRDAPATMLDPGAEPPAIANLLIHRWKVTSAAASATLVDLAARGHLDIDRVGDGTIMLRLRTAHSTRSAEAPLTKSEEAVLEMVRSRAVDGVLPAPALLEGSSTAWFDRFRAVVEQEAIDAGLAKKRWTIWIGVASWSTLTIALLPLAMAFDIWRIEQSALLEQRSLMGAAFVGSLVAFGIVALGRRRLRGLTHTPEGVVAARRLMGVEQWLDERSSFGHIDASAVAVWDRHLAYACALGHAPVVAATFPLAPQPDDEAWSPATGLWRKIEVRVPRRRGEGLAPGTAVMTAGFFTLMALGTFGAAAWFVVTIAGSAVTDVFRDWDGWTPLAFVAGATVLLAMPLGWATLQLWRWAPILVAGLRDGSSRTVLEGVIVKLPTRVDNAGHDDERTVQFTAIDDGSGRPVRALRGCTPHVRLYGRVRVEHSPHLRHVYVIGPADG